MSQRCYWITGASGGMGAELARQLVARGDRVVLTARRAEPLDQLAQELGPNALAVPGDTTIEADCGQAVARGVEHFGRIDGLAHCVGSIVLKPLHLARPDDLRQALDQNLTSAFLASRAVLGALREQKEGSIVLVSSVAARQGLPNHEVIAAAKAGIEGLVRAAAITYAREQVRFNAVAPGLTETGMAAPLIRNESARAFSEAMHPLGRIGQPRDVAAAIAYLLSPESSWITGQILGVDGGLSAGIAPPRPVRS